MCVCIVMEYCPDGDMFGRLEKCHRGSGKLDEATLRDWVKQLCKALDYLHTYKVGVLLLKSKCARGVYLKNIFAESDCAPGYQTFECVHEWAGVQVR